MKYRFIIAMFFCWSVLIVVQSQNDDFQKRYLSISYNYGKTAIHSKYVSNLNGSRPTGISMDFGKHLINEKALKTFGCYPRTGVNLNYWSFDYDEVGWGLTGLFYFEPFIIFRNRFMWSVKGGAGLGWLSNPYSQGENPTNLAYSTHIDFPLFVGVNLYKPINYHWALKLGGSFQHLSNGAIKHPNYGINFSVLSLGVEYSPDSYRCPKKSFSEGLFLEKRLRQNRSEIIVGVGPKDIAGKGYWMSLLQYRYVKQWTRINGWTVGVLGELDGSEEKDFPGNGRLSLLAGHEFFFGKTGFSQEMGWYVHNPTNNKSFHQLYSLHFKAFEHLRVGVNLKAHLNVAEYLGTRVAFIF